MTEVQDFSGLDAAEITTDEQAPPALRASTVAPALALVLAACDSPGGSGGGGGGGGIVAPAPTPTPTPTVPVVSQVQASRFLGQATMGASKLDIADVQTRGIDGWLTAQFGMTRTTSHWDWLVSKGYNVTANINNEQGFDNVMWRQLIAEPGQLRQRVGMALLELMVVGIAGIQLQWKQFAMAAYVDIMLDNAFGNFRTILDRITTNAAMGSYLTFLNNRRANAATGSMPDENYARELMQLFTIGLYRLNMDGTRQLAGGNPIDTYTQTDVSQLARVFTGLTLDSSDGTTPDRYRRPLIFNTNHETGASTFLGTTVPAGADGPTSVRIALDAIFAHGNVPPFVSKQLIQRLVTSNPSAAYVGRVAAVFADNGAGVRGDLRAVVRAILLDTEARSDPVATSTTSGKLREPVMRLTGWARAYNAASVSDTWGIGDTSSSSTRLAQSMGRSSSVFNFFRPGYTPPNTAIATAGLVAPELQITNELSVVAYINYMQALIAATGDFRADYTDALTKATDSQALVDEVNMVLAAGQIGTTTLASIKAAVDSIGTTGTGPVNRVSTAILLTMASPEYLTLK